MARLLVHALFAGASTRISDYAALQWLMREFGDGKAAADRRAFEEARREFDGIEDEPASAGAEEPEPQPEQGLPKDEPAAVGEPEDASQDPASNAAEGAGDKDYTHIWRSKDRDFPCTPTGEEHRDEKDGRLYAEVRRPGGISIVPKDEVITKADALEPKTEPSQERRPLPTPPRYAARSLPPATVLCRFTARCRRPTARTIRTAGLLAGKT